MLSPYLDYEESNIYWSAADEMQWQGLIREHPFLNRIHLRDTPYQPPRPAPWGLNLNPPVPGQGEKS